MYVCSMCHNNKFPILFFPLVNWGLSIVTPCMYDNQYTFLDALIEMIGDSIESVPGVPPDKYYNPGSHITLKCIIRQQLCKSL